MLLDKPKNEEYSISNIVFSVSILAFLAFLCYSKGKYVNYLSFQTIVLGKGLYFV